jgi:flagellar L-ring protein precursor FlgH
MRRLMIVVLVSGLTALSVSRADSLWERRDPRYAYLFQDTRARSVGDTVIITVSESTVTNEQDQKNLSRTTSGSGQVTLFDSLHTPKSTGAAATTGTAGTTLLQFPSQSTAMQFSGSAQNTTNRVFTDRMAVTVVDIMPNGNLIVEGYRSRLVAGEERVLRITGIVRQADIGVGNIVPSGSVANFRISYLGRGPATSTNRQGIFPRLNNVIRFF